MRESNFNSMFLTVKPPPLWNVSILKRRWGEVSEWCYLKLTISFICVNSNINIWNDSKLSIERMAIFWEPTWRGFSCNNFYQRAILSHRQFAQRIIHGQLGYPRTKKNLWDVKTQRCQKKGFNWLSNECQMKNPVYKRGL